MKVKEIGFVGIDGDVKWNGARLVWVVLRGRAKQIAAFVATNRKSIGLAACSTSKVNVPVEVAADDT